MNLTALAALPPLLERRAMEMDFSVAYLREYTPFRDDGAGVATAPLRTVHATVLSWLDTLVSAAAQRLRDQARAVRQALGRYAASDAASAAALDAAVPLAAHHGRLPTATADQAVGPDVFGTVWVAAPQLRDPPWYPPVGVRPPGEPAVGDVRHRIVVWMSDQGGPVGQLGTQLLQAQDVATEVLSGDWRGVRTSAYTYASMADALTVVGDDLTSTRLALGSVWTGHAALACATALGAGVADLEHVAGVLRWLSTVYDETGTDA
ncbi:MAG TPA: hypothetical protein VHA75_04205, partial [Rugosimonospora sp.]|nr:hypothetical protein [Rugosimonospora sp.]